MPFSLFRISNLRIAASVATLVLLSVLTTYAQSSDVRFPTAVEGSEIVGSVPARDIGDARLTDHFYTFNGLPGDILIIVESKNLNGDFDVFTAAELRPLLKVSVYAETATAVSKNIYLRRPESLILRVEARTPNDDEGSYRIRFSGSFAPLDNRSPAADQGTPKEEISQPPRAGDRKTTRVSSAGARIDEQGAEVAVAPTPEPTPVSSTEESTTDVRKTPALPSPRGRRPQPRSTRGSARTPTAENGRLIIEVKDGSRIEYLMSTVTRLTVENGEIVIVSEDGYTKRVPLTNVLRMSIAP